MRRWIAMALLLGLGAGTLTSTALAAKNIKDFKAPHEMTPEEIEASKRASRSNVNPYANQVSDQVTPIPWKAIGLIGAALLIATPLALRYYRDTAATVAGNARRKPRARVREAEEDEPGEPREERAPSPRRPSAQDLTRVPSGRQAQIPGGDPDGTRVPARPPRRPS